MRPEDEQKPVTLTREDFKGLECLKCEERYSRVDVANGEFWLETFICSKCYAAMQAAPYSISCFGKPSVIVSGKYVEYGFNLEAVECRSLCPDRNICARLFKV